MGSRAAERIDGSPCPRGWMGERAGPKAGGSRALRLGSELAAAQPGHFSFLICETAFSGSCLLRVLPGAGPVRSPEPGLPPQASQSGCEAVCEAV